MNDHTQPSAMPMGDEDEISLLDLATALGEEKATLFAIPLITTLVAVVVSLLMTPIFTAKTVVMPPQQQQSGAAAALASMGGLAGLAGLGGGGGLKSPDEMYVAFLGSEGMQNRIIAELKLQERYEAKTLTDARAALKGQVRFASDKKSGLLSIEADDKDPAFAAELANRHVVELRAMLGRLAVTEAQQRRVFYEQQIQQTQDKLALAEVAFRAAKEKSGMQVTSVLAETGVRASAELRGQIASREVQLQAMSRFATAQNPETQRIASELAALRSQLNKTEQGSGESKAAASPLHQEAVKSFRDVKVQEAMLEVLIRQYELARVDEAKEGPLIQQVDVAMPAERKSKPKRAVIVLVAAFAGLFLGVLVAFVRRALRKAQSDPASAGQWLALKKAWSLRG
ncbi:Tyrosine kinase, G-rich domain containing protein [Burkholderiaceae bacterium]